MKKSFIFVIIILVIATISAAWYLASPLFLDKVVDEQFPMENSSLLVAEINITNSSLTKTVYEGKFADADPFHKVSGKAVILDVGDKKYLRLENFTATNGPDLKVYFSTDTSAKDYISLGELKGNIGDQNYEIKQEIDFEKYDTVLIWCERFSVLFGSAELNI